MKHLYISMITKQTNEETYKFKVKVVGVDSPITIEEKEDDCQTNRRCQDQFV